MKSAESQLLDLLDMENQLTNGKIDVEEIRALCLPDWGIFSSASPPQIDHTNSVPSCATSNRRLKNDKFGCKDDHGGHTLEKYSLKRV